MQQTARCSKRPLGIYLHIPFCIRKCLYCDFLSAPGDEQTKIEYVEALLHEIRAQAPLYDGHEVKTVFFGGGTPSLLSGEQIRRIMDCLHTVFSFSAEEGGAEVTMEANPGTLTPEKLADYRRAGINRLSIGLQSASDEELKALGRIHTWKDFLCSYELARKEGFANINIDLMSALPGQTPGGWMETLEKTVRLKPEHISAYSLIIEEGTPFYEMYGEAAAPRGCKALPTEEEDRLMYGQTKVFLAEAGYGRYEISNYSLPGFACRHNISYWERTDYAGFGLGAASLYGKERFANTADRKKYQENSTRPELIREKEPTLTTEDEMAEFMFLGLRMIRGIAKADFSDAFGCPIEEIYGNVLEKYEAMGLLREENGRIFLSREGIHVSNSVMSEFLL